MLTFGVLGPVRAATGAGAVALKGPRHRAVLARLLIARGRVVPVDRLVDDLWAEPPRGAVAALRTFVSDLRRALEPSRPPRQPAHLLVTAPPGYALRAAPEAVDAWRFEAAVGAAARQLTGGKAAAALDGLDDALTLWRGPAYAEYADQGWARAEIDRLDELRLLAVERRAEALLGLARDAEAAADLQGHARDHPLREDGWRLLATALYRSGRQGEALSALREARGTLAAELGVDPGPRLKELEADILAQAAHLDPPRPFAGGDTDSAQPFASGDTDSAQPFASGDTDSARPFVGREVEVAGLVAAAEDAARRGRPVLALVSGDPGTGKTALAEALARRLAPSGWTVEWARGPEHEGAPTAWPWLAEAPAPAPAPAPADDPAVARFRARRAAVDRLTAGAARGPVLLLADDLHRADTDTLDLLAALLGEPWPALVVGTFRATEITPELTAALARFARAEPVRVYLAGLSESATGELARTLAGAAVDAPTARLIHRRSGGNPFFVRELARLLATAGGAALRQVPPGVRDVIRHRLARLPEPAQTVLRQAAVLGREIDPEVLAELAGGPVLDALDAALQAGFLIEDGRPRFTHLLVRDTLYADLSELRRAHWHAAAGAAIERLRPHDVAALAHHFDRAASRDTADRAARYGQAAAEQAERRSQPHEAARLWRLALAAHDRTGPADPHDRAAPHGRTGPRERLAAVLGLGRALAVTGHLDEARRHRAEAIAAAERLGDPELTAGVLAAFDVPAIWTRNDDEALSARIVRAAERVLATLPADRPQQRGRLLCTIALELRGDTTGRGDRAAREAEAIARRLDDPGLLAFALNARFLHTFRRTGLAGERARLGAELVDLAARHELVTFEVLGHLILLQAHSALADRAAADRHAQAADRLAERYDLPLVGVFTQWYAGLRLAVDGRTADAEAAYRAAHARLAGRGMPGLEEGLLPLALLSLRPDAPTEADWGPYEPWVRPLALLAAGRRAEAAAALRALPDSPHDLLWEARLCLAARAARALGDDETLGRLRTLLRPAAGELAGAGSGLLTLGPVAGYL